MKFRSSIFNKEKKWWIIMLGDEENNAKIYGDFDLAATLGLTLEEYRELLIYHGATRITNRGIKFLNKKTVNKFVDYLNETYLPMLHLMGNV